MNLTRAKLLALVMATTAAATFVGTGCDDHDDDDHSHAGDAGGHTSPYPSCNAITQACHEVDVGEGPIHDCHDQAHGAKSDSDCAPIKDQCLQICAEAKADGGATEHEGQDGGDGGEEEEHDGGQ
ncbi:MAG: hypothetical protein K0S65_1810 [Labilithrix sp.]|nr:hypothetical protein [Labilithrix sp.]